MRKIFKFLAALAFISVSSSGYAQTLSLTFDDGLNPEKQPEAALWNRQILKSLKDAGVTAMVFPSLVRIGGEPGLNLIRDWAAQGHAVGNHTSKHRNLGSDQVLLQEFIEDVEEADAVMRQLSNWTPMLRFPYLKEGNTVEKRDGIRHWMKSNGYKPAPVSVDASDWYYNRIYAAFLEEGQPDKATRVKSAYIEHLLDRAAYYDDLAKQAIGRSPAHVMLLHTSQINAAAVSDIIGAFRSRGWNFVSPMTAFEDPIYSIQIDILPAGESIVWSNAKARGISGLRYPAEDSVYEEPKLRARDLVPERSAQ